MIIEKLFQMLEKLSNVLEVIYTEKFGRLIRRVTQNLLFKFKLDNENINRIASKYINSVKIEDDHETDGDLNQYNVSNEEEKEKMRRVIDFVYSASKQDLKSNVNNDNQVY